MCGRYSFTAAEAKEIQQIIQEVSDKLYGQSIKTGEIYPTNIAPVIAAEGGQQIPTIMQWGFPHFKGSGVIINAMAETITEKKMFRDSVIAWRCVIPSTGFYEWGEENSQLTLFETPKTKGNKNKYLFTLQEQKALYMAGIYKQFKGEDIPRFVILTTAANKSISDIHERMPVVLRADKQSEWLSENADFDKIFDRQNIQLKRIPA
ncbi:SOS response-associated peptidase [Oscillospiraceae bacterium MB08-C2-2]|nr:SOS response-associated peptidase [Oscillospiraceae bacterium MB08-C2-2]